MIAPVLLRKRTGRLGGLVLVIGFGALPIVGGVLTIATTGHLFSVSGLIGVGKYLLLTSPFILAGVIAMLCKSELFFDPATRTFRTVTLRPWRGTRTATSALSDYAGIAIDGPNRKWGGGYRVALITSDGDDIDLLFTPDLIEAQSWTAELTRLTGLWVRERGG